MRRLVREGVVIIVRFRFFEKESIFSLGGFGEEDFLGRDKFFFLC